MKNSQENLPEIAKRFLRSKRRTWTASTMDRVHSPINQFHVWLDKNGLSLEFLNEADLRKYIEHCKGRQLGRESLRVLFSCLCHYLKWLKIKKIIRVNVDTVFPSSSLCAKPLPETLQQFISFMSVNLRPNTINYYQNCSLDLHKFLRRRNKTIGGMDRRDFEGFLESLYHRGLTVSSRVQWIISVRVYLRWLFEHGLIEKDPDEFIHITDFPKVPDYLPRPLPVTIDQELQRRFAASPDFYHRCLLLMRWTGIRVGELIDLSYDCIKIDSTGNKFLKVELGKMKNERLVPLHDQAVDLIEAIQWDTCSHYANNGSEGPPIKLLNDPHGRIVISETLRKALAVAADGLQDREKITSHRLRHTYATELLNAGVSFFTLMKLLGHRHFKMTMRYAAVTQETIRKEYFTALDKISNEIDMPESVKPASPTANPLEALPDLVKWLQVSPDSHKLSDRELKLLSRRIQQIQRDIQSSFKKSDSCDLA